MELAPTDPGDVGVDPVRTDTKDKKDAEVTDFQAATSPTTMRKCPCLPKDLALAMANVL